MWGRVVGRWRQAGRGVQVRGLALALGVVAVAAAGLFFFESTSTRTPGSRAAALSRPEELLLDPSLFAWPPTSTPVPGPPTPTPLEILVRALATQTAAAEADAASARSRASAGLSGPGAITATGWSISIPSLGVRATVYGRSIGSNGVMGNPAGAWDVIWYDFSRFPGLGGTPGQLGANAVFAGHLNYVGVGPAVFAGISRLRPGDTVTVYTREGAITYAVQWSQRVGAYDDVSNLVASTGRDAITLVTCIGTFRGGEYDQRIVVRGTRV